MENLVKDFKIIEKIGIPAAPYLAGVLGVPEHPWNLGVQERGEA